VHDEFHRLCKALLLLSLALPLEVEPWQSWRKGGRKS
jgi:hypothetical protein